MTTLVTELTGYEFQDLEKKSKIKLIRFLILNGYEKIE
jgi:hypothetical protein